MYSYIVVGSLFFSKLGGCHPSYGKQGCSRRQLHTKITQTVARGARTIGAALTFVTARAQPFATRSRTT